MMVKSMIVQHFSSDEILAEDFINEKSFQTAACSKQSKRHASMNPFFGAGSEQSN
jgi:hypothetical protein